MSISISPVNMNNTNPSFKGVVKVNLVFLDRLQTSSETVVDSATKQLKAILMKKADTPATTKAKEIFRKIYHFFDRDYKIPETAPRGDAREIFSKVRTGTLGNEVYLVSGDDAAAIAVNGKNIGGKKALARIDNRKSGLVQPATDDYFSIKDEMAAKYSRNPQKPGIYLYMFTDKKGVARLAGARMENIANPVNAKNPWTQTVVLNPQYVTPKSQNAVTSTSNAVQKTKSASSAAKTPTAKPDIQSKAATTETQGTPVIPATPAASVKDSKPVQMQGLADGIPCEDKGRNQTLEELSTKNWDSAKVKTKKTKPKNKKIKDAPGQMTFNF